MLRRSFLECIDAGSENCPCYLSETNDCMTCTRLQGLGYCDCKWTGVCIYNEYMWNNKKAKNPRQNIDVEIVSKKMFGQVMVLVLQTNKYLSQRFKYPGTYVFIRHSEDTEMYNVPMSIMYVDTDKDQIHIAVKIISSKTKRLLEAKTNLKLRGPYRNGILGRKHLDNAEGGNLLILCRNMGIAPTIKLIKYYDLKSNIDLVADINTLESNYAEPYLNETNANVHYMNFDDSQDINLIKSMINEKNYDAIALFTSDKHIAFFDEMLKTTKYKNDYSIINNFNICCGEGVCGACSFMTESGEVIKMCKCQMKGKEILKRRPINV